MKPAGSRMIAWLLLAAGAVGVLVLSFRPSRIDPVTTETTAPASQRPSPAPPRTGSTDFYNDSESEPPMPPNQLDPSLGRPESGTGEAYLDHLARSVIVANAGELQLDSDQQERLVADFLEFQEIHAELAVRHLQEASYDGAEVQARVPPFLSEGQALRDLYYQRLRNDFPEDAFQRITDQLGSFFDTHFRGYGITEQTFTITRSPEHSNAFQIEWQALPVEGQTPSRQAEEAGYAGSSGVALYSRDQIKNGEFRFLGDLIDRRFP